MTVCARICALACSACQTFGVLSGFVLECVCRVRGRITHCLCCCAGAVAVAVAVCCMQTTQRSWPALGPASALVRWPCSVVTRARQTSWHSTTQRCGTEVATAGCACTHWCVCVLLRRCEPRDAGERLPGEGLRTRLVTALCCCAVSAGAAVGPLGLPLTAGQAGQPAEHVAL